MSIRSTTLAALILTLSAPGWGQSPPQRATLADVAWISGNWVGGAGGLSIEERWTPAAGGAMLGVSRTTEFTLTAFDATSATFENPAHDYPKVIRYSKQADGTLEARISAENGQRPQTFVFRRE